uniref:D-alanyl-D-alanine carboxypeptidase n=1 Tax=Kribbia dieselivorans TaxID=331526 RepID=UPI00157B0C6D
VAGGDTMLARGAGRPGEVEGHAGLADLAAQTVRSLKASGAPKRITVRLDASYARGPRYPSTWNMADVAGGFTQGVTMIGLAGQRPEPGKPSPARPEAEALTAFAAALTKAGIPATVTAHESTWATAAPKSATELGSVASAPIADVLGEALLHSDNALTENLVRQAAVAAGLSGDMKSAVTLMRRTLTDAKINTSGMVLRDASGLSSGQKVPARIVADVLTAGTEGELPGMAATIVQLPVGGYNGSLFDRFDESDSRAAAGVPRAKTGTLTGISGLAGTTITRDGRLLTYVIVADRNSDTLAARAALDRVVAQLTTLQSSKGRP